ncbi:MAG TPA: type II toxin-antitoxin system PemK/MazF family toxin [Rectinemataceae bacterium]
MTRGELWWADFGITFGSETGYRRPVLIMQNDAFNESKIRTVVIVPLTTNLALADAPGNVYIDKKASGLSKDSVAVVSQLSAIDKRRINDKVGKIEGGILNEIEEGIKLVLGID